MQGREGGVDVYMRDITDRKNAEEALRKSEEEYRHLVKYAPAAIYEISHDGLRFRRVNDAMCHILGYTPAELLEMNPFDILDEESKVRFGERVKKRLTGEDIDESVAYRIFGRDGREIWVTLNVKLNYEDGGGTLVVAHDVTERKRAEDALRESEERFRLALRNAPISVAIQDNDLVFQWAYNQRTVSPDEVRGKKDTDIFTPEDAARLIELKRACLVTGKEVREKIWLMMNGKRVFLDLYLEPLRDGNGQITGIGIATVDLTEQKLIEDALRYSEENLLQAQELLDDVTKGTDVIIAVQDTNFRYIFFNQPYKEEIKRLTGKDLTIGTSMIELFGEIPEEQRRSINEWSKVLMGENINQTITFGYSGKDSRVYHVLHTPIRDANGNIVAAGEVAFDITRQAQVEEALRETKEYLDNLITYANAPIIVWDPHYHITVFNRAFEHLTGRKAKEVLGKPLDILLPENYLTPAMDLIRKTMVGERWDSVEIPILHKKGGIRTILWNSASIFGADGHTIVSTIAQGQDITDRKMLESETRLRAKGYAEMNIVLEAEIRQRKISDTALKNTLSLLNASLESTADGILVVDRHAKITSFNKNFMNMWNIPPVILESGNNQTVLNYVLPQLKNPEGFLSSIRELDVHPGRESFDMIEFNDGKIFERYSKPQKIGESVVGRVWSFRDVTDRKHAEENLVASLQEKEVLLREIHHRVKNNLQLISGLLDMTRMRTSDESTNSILTDLMLKIQTMAQIHTRLYESKQFGKISLTGQIRDQVAALSNIYSHKGHEIICEIEAQEIFLPVDQAIPCALVVNEILSNAYKHAFKGRKRGTIEISAVGENGQIRITIRDDGIGLPGNFDISRTNSLGLKLVRTLVQYQLKGSLMFKSQNGTEFSMEFPVITVGT
jgi:PAS domain S-box-containing protein